MGLVAAARVEERVTVTGARRKVYTTAADGVHPLYRKYWVQWYVNELTYLGGIDYQFPDVAFDWVRGKYSKASPEKDEEELAPEPTRLTSFLQPFGNESGWNYAQRVLMSEPPGVVSDCVDKLVAFVLGQRVVRDGEGVPGLGVLWDEQGDADLAGASWHEVMSDVGRGALVAGLRHVVVDYPPEGSGVASRPYVRVVSPLEVPKWKADAYGRLVRACVLEPDTRDGGDYDTEELPPLMREWDRESWRLLDAQGGVISEGANPFGEIPIFTLYCRRAPGCRMFGLTPTHSAARVNQRLYNLTSEITQLERVLFPIPVITGTTTLGRQEISTLDAMLLAPGGTFSYATMPSDPMRALAERAVQRFRDIRSMYGLSRGAAEESVAARSGDALMVEASERASIVTSLAKQMQAFETQIGRFIARFEGRTWESSVRYPDSYDVETLAEKVAAADALLRLPGLPKPAADAIVDDAWRQRLAGILSADRLAEVEDAVAASRAPAEIDSGAPVLRAAMIDPSLAAVETAEAAPTAAAIEAAKPPEFYDYHIARGIVTKNEVRARLGLPPIDGGDKTLPEAVREGEPGTMDGEEAARKAEAEPAPE